MDVKQMQLIKKMSQMEEHFLLALCMVILIGQVQSSSDKILTLHNPVAQITDLTLEYGSDASLPCQASDVSAGTNQNIWLRYIQDTNGSWIEYKTIEPSTNADITRFSVNGSLLIYNLKKQDAGKYTCITSNKAGENVYITYKIQVLMPKTNNTSSSLSSIVNTSQFVHAVGIGVSASVFIFIFIIIIGAVTWNKFMRKQPEHMKDPNEGSLLNDRKDSSYNVV